MPKGTFFGFLFLAVALIATSMATPVSHATPREKLRKRHPVKTLPPPAPFIPTFNSEQMEYLKAHNDLRLKVNVTPLVWDANLTAEAHAWAVQRSADCDYRHHSPNRHGESIYWMNYHEFTPTDVVQWWFSEYKLYDNIHHVCTCKPERNGCECGHFLNIVWSTTKRVGCSGAVYCDDQKGVYVVCQYDPAGLIPGINPFTGHKLHVGGI